MPTKTVELLHTRHTPGEASVPGGLTVISRPLALAALLGLAAGVIVAVLGRVFPEVPQAFLFVFFLATAAAGYIGGLGAGLLAVAFSLAGGVYFLFVAQPTRMTSGATQVLIVFGVTALASAYITGRLREARLLAEEARTEAERLTARMRELQQVTDTRLASLPLDELLHELLVHVRDMLSVDTAAVLLLNEAENMLEAHAAAGLEEEVERGVRIPLGRGFAGRIATERQPVILEDAQHADVLNPLLQEKGIASLLGVPLIVEGRVLGILHVGSLRRRSFRPQDVQLLQLVADRVALAIENARLYQSERHRAELLDALVKVATDIHGAGRIEDLMHAIAEAAQRLAGGGIAFAGFFRGRGEPDPTEYRQWEVAGVPRQMFEHLDNLHITPLFAPTFRGEGTVRADDVRVHPLFRGLPDGHVPVVSYLAVPIVSRSGQTLGAILLGHPESGRFDADVQAQLESLARQAGVALENALLYERERSTAATLQRSLLPERMPEIPGIGLAVRYLPSGTGEIGGDWYDVLELGDGNLALVMGDVVGRGVRAAAVMGQLRNALRAYALEDNTPGALATRLNALTDRLASPNLVTLVYLLLDLSSLQVRYIRAGHLPPLLIAPDGTATLLEGGHSLPLGVDRDAVFPEGRARLLPGSTLLLYTDGLVDHPGVPLETALARLRESAVRARDRAPDPLLEQVLTDVLPDASRQDDVALMALRIVPHGNRIALRVPAEPGSVAVLRQAMRRWFAEQAITPEESFAILVAMGEAVGNAIEHAYGPGGGQLEVDAEREEHGVTVCIRDFGQWRAPRGAGRGRGFQLMQGLMDDVAVSHEHEGTEVRLRYRLPREAPV